MTTLFLEESCVRLYDMLQYQPWSERLWICQSPKYGNWKKIWGPWICSKDESLVAQTLGHGPSPSVAPGPCGARGPWGPWTGCVTKPTNGYEASLHRQGNSEAWINHCINWKSAFTSKGFKRLARWRDAFGAYETEQWKLRLIINTIWIPNRGH